MPEPALNDVMDNVISTLSGYLTASGGSLPSSTVSFLSVAKKNPAIGNRIATDTRAGYPIAAIKAGHLDANLQLQIWHTNPDTIEVEMNDLQGRILADKTLLHEQGFIKLKSDGGNMSEHISNLNAWRKTSQLNVLYEYRYQDNDDALSIIHRIPITNDLEQNNSSSQELSTVTDVIQRWDDEEAWSLNISANSTQTNKIYGLSVLAYLPGGWNGNQVILQKTNLDNPNPPNLYANLADFIEAVTDQNSPDQNARILFASVTDFVGALELQGSNFELGDWDEDNIPDQYQAYQTIFENPIQLNRMNDEFRVSYQAAPFDSKAVVYLRAKLT
ncbi:hypothetical protein [Paraglaciecola sp. MB-3u-78]|uniref:hypothetical protein n=1 Tax=Paraglaciecola sp. MB-3u-78 TaxID=2058332 RepID=UPI000C34A7DD|nr:hypothetical protein [Paraglaciecola sp. MB-3u-78]PKH00452.1 hypothetical protein CXF95_02625 [Paraglaciecola sp. MB-3u-78]